eukprot:PhM_4_TR8398/c1_g2_i2/m.62646
MRCSAESAGRAEAGDAGRMRRTKLHASLGRDVRCCVKHFSASVATFRSKLAKHCDNVRAEGRVHLRQALHRIVIPGVSYVFHLCGGWQQGLGNRERLQKRRRGVVVRQQCEVCGAWSAASYQCCVRAHDCSVPDGDLVLERLVEVVACLLRWAWWQVEARVITQPKTRNPNESEKLLL